jgi:hypothetical protein
MAGHIDVSNLAVDNAAVASMACRSMPIQHELIRLENGDKFCECAF